MPAGRPYTSFLNPDAQPRMTPKGKKAKTFAQVQSVLNSVKKTPQFAALKKQMGY